MIEKIVAFGNEGESDVVTLRNVGGQKQDLTGWKLVDSDGDERFAYELGGENCEDQYSIAPTQKLDIFPESENNTCGYAFNINFRWVYAGSFNRAAAVGDVAASELCVAGSEMKLVCSLRMDPSLPLFLGMIQSKVLLSGE